MTKINEENVDETIEKLTNKIATFPGIGRKSAKRLAYHFVINSNEEEIQDFLQDVSQLKQKVFICEKCNVLTKNEDKICDNCLNTKLKDVLLLFTSYFDLDKVSNTRLPIPNFRNFIIPINNSIMDETTYFQQQLQKLENYIKEYKIKELIIITSFNLDGNIAIKLTQQNIKTKFPNLKMAKLALGIPMGGNIEYIDEVTLLKAFEKREII